MNKQNLTKMANLAVKSGVNIQEGDELFIRASAETLPLCREVVKEAYKAGAKKVFTFLKDDEIEAITYNSASNDSLASVLPFEASMHNYFTQKNSAILSIISYNPDAFENVSSQAMSIRAKAFMQAAEPFYNEMMGGGTRWSIIAYPNEKWARKMFPDMPTDKALEKLESYIAHTSRIDNDDPVKEWAEHSALLQKRCEKLNGMNIKTLHYKNSLGTDLIVGMPDGYKFMGGSEMTKYGIPFNANIPSEEVFSAPDRNNVNGRIVASKPLVFSGKVVKNFYFDFKDGVVVNFHADEGESVLDFILKTDEGAKRLGEVALVPHASPISDLDTLFYDTLFDENASCHFALGRAYETCLNGGENLTKAELLAKGINISLTHVDFMIGTSDLSIIATNDKGDSFPIFVDGNFCF